jgi:hypothetical protein
MWVREARDVIARDEKFARGLSNKGVIIDNNDKVRPIGGGGAFGIWGADRNGNGRFDKGAIRPGQRLRAIEVARFVIYDPTIRTGLTQ